MDTWLGEESLGYDCGQVEVEGSAHGQWIEGLKGVNKGHGQQWLQNAPFHGTISTCRGIGHSHSTHIPLTPTTIVFTQRTRIPHLQSQKTSDDGRIVHIDIRTGSHTYNKRLSHTSLTRDYVSSHQKEGEA